MFITQQLISFQIESIGSTIRLDNTVFYVEHFFLIYHYVLNELFTNFKFVNTSVNI